MSDNDNLIGPTGKISKQKLMGTDAAVILQIIYSYVHINAQQIKTKPCEYYP